MTTENDINELSKKLLEAFVHFGIVSVVDSALAVRTKKKLEHIAMTYDNFKEHEDCLKFVEKVLDWMNKKCDITDIYRMIRNDSFKTCLRTSKEFKFWIESFVNLIVPNLETMTTTDDETIVTSASECIGGAGSAEGVDDTEKYDEDSIASQVMFFLDFIMTENHFDCSAILHKFSSLYSGALYVYKNIEVVISFIKCLNELIYRKHVYTNHVNSCGFFRTSDIGKYYANKNFHESFLELYFLLDIIYSKNALMLTERSFYPPVLFGNYFLSKKLKCAYSYAYSVQEFLKTKNALLKAKNNMIKLKMSLEFKKQLETTPELKIVSTIYLEAFKHIKYSRITIWLKPTSLIRSLCVDAKLLFDDLNYWFGLNYFREGELRRINECNVIYGKIVELLNKIDQECTTIGLDLSYILKVSAFTSHMRKFINSRIEGVMDMTNSTLVLFKYDKCILENKEHNILFLSAIKSLPE